MSDSYATNLPVRPIILVQGATGRTGFATVSALLKQARGEYKIRAGVRDLTKASKLTALGTEVEVVLLDTEFPQTTKEAFHGVSKLMICPPNTEDRAEVVKLLIQSAVNHKSIRHIGMISMLDAYKDTISFHKQFRAMEHFLEHSGIAFTVFRCPMFMDNFLNFAAQILKGELRLPLQNAATSLISTADVGAFVASVLSSHDTIHERKYYNVTGSEFLDGNKMAQSIGEGLGIVVAYSSVSSKDAFLSFLNSGFESWQARGFAELFDYVVYEDSNNVFGDFEMILGRKAALLSQWTFENRHAFIGSELLQSGQRQERHVQYDLDSTQSIVNDSIPPGLIHKATNEQGQQTTNQQGQQGAAYFYPGEHPIAYDSSSIQHNIKPVALYQKTPFPHLSGHTALWYANYFPQHQERRARAVNNR